MVNFRSPQKFLIVLILVFSGISVYAEVPRIINYQGRLTDTAGEPLPDTTIDITFSIYRVTGVQEWTSGPQPVSVSNGVFTYALGSNVPLTDDIISSSYSRFLGIKVGNDDEIVPRTQLATLIPRKREYELDMMNQGRQ